MLNGPPPRRRPLLVFGVVALVVVLAAVATYFVIAWTQARNDWTAANDAWLSATNDLLNTEANDSIAFAKAREEVARAGQAAIITMHVLDYRKVDEGLDNWEKVSTGALHDEVVSRRATSKQAIVNAKTDTAAEALTAAITELDARAGTATMIAAMKVTVRADGGQSSVKFLRTRGALHRTADGWKLSGINQVDVAR